MHIMGILNVTPDSFSDGGEHFGDLTDIVADALQMVDEGADIIDIGGQSTRPGAHLVDVDEEIARVVHVVYVLSKETDVTISVDTMSSIVAEHAIASGAHIINDVSAGQNDPRMASLIAKHPEVKYIAMHSRGQGDGMKSEVYGDVVHDVIDELSRDIKHLIDQGIKRSQIICDPGPGFSKSTGSLNWPLLARIDEFKQLGYPVLFAASRKRFIGELLSGTVAESDPKERDIATAATSLIAFQKGVWGVRVHNVRGTVDAVKVARAVENYTRT